MAPPPPSSSVSPQPRSLRRPQDHGQGGKRSGGAPQPPERSSSFPGRTAPPEQRQLRRPKTQTDLLAGGRKGWTSPEMAKNNSGGGGERGVRVPAKVLVNVTVQRSLGALHVMASTEWTVEDLVAAAVRMYVKEGRRPQLPTTEPSAYGLHYSQFSLECLDPKEKLIVLGSRNFFLCPKNNNNATADTAAASSVHSTSSCSKEAEKASRLGIPWLRFIGFFP